MSAEVESFPPEWIESERIIDLIMGSIPEDCPDDLREEIRGAIVPVIRRVTDANRPFSGVAQPTVASFNHLVRALSKYFQGAISALLVEVVNARIELACLRHELGLPGPTDPRIG